MELFKFFNRKTTNPVVGSRSYFGYRGGMRVDDDSSMRVSAYNRGVLYIATQIAKLPWDVKDKNNNFVYNSVSKLIATAPNPEMTSFFFRLWAVITAINHGNAYSEIERNVAGQPIAIWPLITSDVQLVRSTTGQLYYRVTNGEGVPDAYLRPEDVFHVKNFHTKDGLIGQGVVAYAMETLGISLSADQMASGLFQNGGIPSGVITVEGTIDDAAFNRMKADWRAQYGGRKTGGTAILEQGAKYSPINIPPEALQFLQSRQFGVLEIARFLGVPPTKLYDVTASTYSNVEQANLEVATDTLDAWAVNLETEADMKLLNNNYGERFTELDLYAVFRGDMQTRSTYNKTMLSIGAMTPNEARKREGLPPYLEGDNFYIATNNFTPVDRMDEVIDAQIASKNKTEPVADKADSDTTKALNEAALTYLTRK